MNRLFELTLIALAAVVSVPAMAQEQEAPSRSAAPAAGSEADIHRHPEAAGRKKTEKDRVR